MPEQPAATYLGDGLYVTAEDWGQVELFTHNGLGKTNQVFLEPSVLEAFERWLEQWRKGARP